MQLAHTTQLLEALRSSLQTDTFVKLTLSTYKGKEEALKNLIVRPVVVKKEPKLTFTYRYKTRDIVKNYEFSEGLTVLEKYVQFGEFHSAVLFTMEGDMYLTILSEGKSSLKRKAPSTKEKPEATHDKKKARLIEATSDKKYLYELKITDRGGKVYDHAQDKYKQINHYIELLAPLIKELPEKELNVVDMGAGKGYLTFALYDYLTNVVGRKATVEGVEFRKDLVELCNTIASKSGLEGLHFVEGTIENYENPNINMLVALHACDTATDDAIWKGIQAGAELIVVAPCCHKQIRREIEHGKKKNDLDFLMKYGIFLERESEMVTDGIRALVLEYFGYSTNVFQFISDAHTPKNVLIVGQKKKGGVVKDPKVLEKIQKAKEYFGIREHYLERVAGL